jgi:signal transduction histidine kinase
MSSLLTHGAVRDLHTGMTRSRSRAQSAAREAEAAAAEFATALRGRLLASALASGDEAEAAGARAQVAESQATRASYVLALDDRLAASVEAPVTRQTIAGVAFPEKDAWAIIDLAEADGSTVRLAIVHPDPARQEMASLLSAGWIPRDGDRIGLPALRGLGEWVAVTDTVDGAVRESAHSAANLDLLLALGFDACLIVPIVIDDRILGAITFVSGQPRTGYSPEEIALAERIARACAHALRTVDLFSTSEARVLAAEALYRSRTDAWSHVTHELRTPLSAIGGYAELLELGTHGELTPAQRVDIGRIRWNQHHLLGLIGDILTYVRGDAGGIEFVPADVDLREVGREVCEMLEPLFAKKQQRFVPAEGVLGPVVARADARRVQQIVINLVTNASKYSPEASEVSVRCAVEGEWAFIEVVDAGDGIPEAHRESIFEPFVQLAAGASGRQGGVGLGLAIARQLARGMAGDVGVAAGPGGGSVFRLRLPCAARAVPEAADH